MVLAQHTVLLQILRVNPQQDSKGTTLEILPCCFQTIASLSKKPIFLVDPFHTSGRPFGNLLSAIVWSQKAKSPHRQPTGTQHNKK